MASTPSSRTLKSPVNVAKPTAKLLQRKSVMLDLFGELMDSSLTIDRSSIASGAILVTHGDPKKVADTIHKVVGEINVLAAENDEQVLNVLNSLKEKFPGQFDTDFERSSSTYISAFHRKVKTEVEPEIASLATKTGRFSVSRQHMNYLQCHLDHLQEDVHASWPDSGVSITVQMEDRGQGSLLVSSKRFDFEDVKGFIENFAANVQQFSKDVEPSRALFLSSGRGQKEVRRLEREHNCRVSVLLPVHQVLVRAECPRGHQLFLCEGNMAATDCSVLVFPFRDNVRDWPPTQRLILERGLLTTKTELYAKFLGGSPKAHRLKLQSQRPEDEQTIWLLYLPDIPASHPLMPEELADGLAEALRLTSSCGAGLAVPLAMSVKHSLDENLNSILRVIEDHLKEKENSETIFLYLEKSSASVKQTLVQVMEKAMSNRWKIEADLVAVYEKSHSSSPSLVIVGQTQNVETTFSKLQTILVPSDFQERSCILDTEIKPGLSLCRLSESMTSELGAGRDARGQKYKEKNEEKKKDEEKPVRTVEVNVGDNIQTEDTYIFYFETRRHGGGDVEKVEIEREKGIVRVTFVKPEVAARVASQQHKIAGQPVEVTLYVPPIPKPPYPDKLLFHNVAESTTRDCLAMYLERITGQEPTDLMYADEVGDVLAVFDEDPDFSKVQEMCRQKKLEGRQISVSRVPISNCMLVENLNKNTTENTILFYFEGKRSGGGPVEKVAIDHENGRCLVFFENYEVIEKILEKSHTLDGSQLKVRLYMECLGPSGGRRDGNIFVLPRPVEFREVDKYKVAFIQQSSTLQGGLTHQLTALHAKPKFSDNTLSVECTLTTSVEHARLLARTWTNDVQNAVNFIFSMVVVFRQDVVQEIWDETEKSVTTIRPVSQDCAIILTLSEEKMFIVVGVKCMADHLMKQVKRIVNHKEEECERKKQEITETNRNLKLFQLRLLAATYFQSEAAKLHPGLKVDIRTAKGEISYHGLLRDVKEAQVEMYELLQSVRSDKITNMSNLQKSLLGTKETRDYVVHKFKSEKIVAVWDVDSQGEINVYSFSDKYLVNAIHIMQKSLVQHQRPLEPETADLLMSPEWNQFVGKITGDYVGVLKIVHLHNGHQLFIAGTDNIMLAVIEETERFLKENTIYMLSYHFFPSLQIFVANYWRAKVMRMSNNLRAYKVEVSLDESGKEFHIRGTKTGLDLMTKNFEQLGSEVKCHMQTLTDPAKVRFLSTPNWEKELEKLGRSTQCVFSLKEEPVDLVVQSDSSQRITSEVASKPSVNPKSPNWSSKQATSGSVRRSPKKFSSSSEVEVTKLFVYGESTESIRRALRRFDDLVKESSQAKKLWMA
ncbi:uncharacterized protein LOC112564207 isoform X2 [Pomacea canaliculata]|nr:uncharacterized protein LOC112564207 isoform X2 [Pomacea canaliculata]